MCKFEATIWYRYLVGDEQEQDFETLEIEAENQHEATQQVFDLYSIRTKRVFKIEVKKL